MQDTFPILLQRVFTMKNTKSVKGGTKTEQQLLVTTRSMKRLKKIPNSDVARVIGYRTPSWHPC
jgi:methyl coenzyme M reductase gamma subunit